MTSKENISPKLAAIYPGLCSKDGQQWNEAWEEFYKLTYNLMLGWAIRVLGDREEAQDIVQLTYFNVSERLRRNDLDPVRDLYAFCFRSLKNTMAESHRKKMVRQRVAPTVGFDAVVSEEREAYLEMDQIFSKQIDFLIDLAVILDTLTQDERKLLTLYYLLEMSVEKICQQLGYGNSNSLYQALSRARGKVRREIEKRELTGADFLGISW